MVVKDKGGEVSASIDETNRIRAALGMAPLKGTAAPTADADAAEPSDGPALGPTWQPAASAAAVAAPEADESGDGAEAVLALTLDRYTSARPKWRK